MQKTPSLMEKPPFLMEKPPVLMTDFQRSYTVLLFNNILPHGNFWQYNGSPLNIFVLYTEAHFLSLFFISVAFYDDLRSLYLWSYFGEKKFARR